MDESLELGSKNVTTNFHSILKIKTADFAELKATPQSIVTKPYYFTSDYICPISAWRPVSLRFHPYRHISFEFNEKSYSELDGTGVIVLESAVSERRIFGGSFPSGGYGLISQ